MNFVIYGEPKGKGRPKFSRRGNYVSVRTPEETVSYENLVKTEYRNQCGQERFDPGIQLGIHLTAYYQIPASASKKKQEAMLRGEIGPTKKPDIDNVLKIVADSLNKIAYYDDSQITEAYLQKGYSVQPRVEVSLYEFKPKPNPSIMEDKNV